MDSVSSINTHKVQKHQQLENNLGSLKTNRTRQINSIWQKANAAATSEAKFNPNTSIFNDPRAQGLNSQSQVAQSADNQKTAANASANDGNIIASAVQKATQLIATVVQKFDEAISLTKAELSALSSSQTSGQAVRPQDNMPTDNQGSQNEIKNSNNDNQINNQETVQDAKNDETIENNNENTTTNEANTSSEIDKSIFKQIDQQYEQSYNEGQSGLTSIFDNAESELNELIAS